MTPAALPDAPCRIYRGTMTPRMCALVLTVMALVAPPAGADVPPAGPDGATLVERVAAAPGLQVETWRHTKTVRDYSRLTNLLRSYPATIQIRCVVADPARYDLRLLDGALDGELRSPVRTIVERSGALGAVNAGFFDERGRPLGLHILRGRALSPLGMPGKTSAGIFYRRDGRYNIISAATYRRYYVDAPPPTPMEEAVQSYPLLVALGRPLWRWRAGAGLAARTAVGMTHEGSLVIVVTETDPLNGLSLAELAGFMATTLRCDLALALDGGGSTQLYLHHGGLELDLPGHDRIRTALGLFPRGHVPR